MQKGFTLIELLIVVALIAIIAAVVFVTLNPLTRFQDARDSQRWAAITSILNAIKIDQVDNGGAYLGAVAGITAGEVYMIVDGATVTGCDDNNASCDVDVTDDDNCVDLSGLVTEGYLGSVAVSPKGAATWSSTRTGYTLQRNTSGIIIVRACESENTSDIWVAR